MVATSCREDELVVPTEYDIIGDERLGSDIRGFYLVRRRFLIHAENVVIIFLICHDLHSLR